jgi:hypothetical protein
LVQCRTFTESPNKIAIFIFKTNINKRPLKPTAQMFECKIDIARWSVNLGDKDKILGVECINNNPHSIVEALSKIGISCKELI